MMQLEDDTPLLDVGLYAAKVQRLGSKRNRMAVGVCSRMGAV